MAVVHRKDEKDHHPGSSLYSPEFVKKTQIVWSKIYDRELTDKEARAIIETFSEFATCLKSIVIGGRHENVQNNNFRPS